MKNGIKLSVSGGFTSIDPWTTSGFAQPAGTKAAIIFGTTDNTTWETGGEIRGNGPRAYNEKRIFTVYASKTGTTTSSFIPIFSSGAGEEDKGRPETNSGSGVTPVFLNSSGNFSIAVYANYSKGSTVTNDTMYFKLYMLGYCL
jgi:hypothetical protein